MPYTLNDKQIDFILKDIKARGIEIDKLQINLLDHVCCILEGEMNEGDDFETCYHNTIKRFYENDLIELQKETKGLLKFKHYYTMKGLFYFLLVLSLSYNIYGAGKLVINYLEERKYAEEHFPVKEANLTDEYNNLIQRMLKEYPNITKQEFVCVFFPSVPLSIYENERFGFDSLMQASWERGRAQQYRTLDSLANIYNKNITYIVAFQGSDKITDDEIAKYKLTTKNLLFLNRMNKLLSGYHNSKERTIFSLPANFILNNSGSVVFEYTVGIERIDKLAKHLKSLSN